MNVGACSNCAAVRLLTASWARAAKRCPTSCRSLRRSCALASLTEARCRFRADAARCAISVRRSAGVWGSAAACSPPTEARSAPAACNADEGHANGSAP